MRRVLIATPAKGGIPDYYFKSYDQVVRTQFTDYDLSFCVESGHHVLSLARNVIAEASIEENFDKVVMIDKDHPWLPQHLARIISHAEPIVCGVYCKKKPGKPAWLGIASRGAKPREDGLLPAEFLPTGFLAIDVAALRTMKAKMPEREFVYEDEDGAQKTATEYFPIGLVGPNTAEAKIEQLRAMAAGGSWASVLTMADLLKVLNHIVPKSGRLLGEDYHFSHLARRCGIPLFIDTKCVIGHVGDIVFPVGPEAVATAMPIPVAGFPDNGFKYEGVSGS